MTPWQDERWATTPTNDGRNYAAAHRLAVVEARPLCFGLREANYWASGMPCGDCNAYNMCCFARATLKRWASDDVRLDALARLYRAAKEG